MQTQNTVLLDFYSEHCGPCRMLSRDLDDISKDYSDIEIKKLNIIDNYELTEKYNVMSVPTLVLIKDNTIKSSYVGYKGRDDLVKFLEDNR